MQCVFNDDGPPWVCGNCGFTHPGQRKPQANCRSKVVAPETDETGPRWHRYYDYCMVCGELGFCEIAKCRRKIRTEPCPQGNW